MIFPETKYHRRRTQAIPKGDTAHRVFAKGHALTDEFYREKSSMVMGQIDCVISIPVNDFDHAIADGHEEIKIKVETGSVRVLRK